jgi:cardiolipin synthase
MLHAISTAQRSVTLCSYIFDGDETGLAFAGALAGAVRRGVAVRVLIDASSELFSSRPIVHALRRAHVPCRKFLPAFSTWPPVSLHLRNHRKLLVVDGRVGFTGGMNIMTGHWLRRRPARPVLDLHFKVEGPVVAQLQEAFADDWRFTTGEILAGESWFPPPASAGHSLVRGIASGPGQRIHPLRWLLLTAIGAAQRSIWILTPYFVPNAAIIAALSVARLRGVSVEILLPCRGDVPFVQWASAAHWWQLLEPGCRIWVAPPPFDHTKLCVVDDEWSLVGSPNWDPRSLALNYEFALECYDPAVAAELSSQFLERRERAREVTLAEMDARSLPLRLRDGLARLAAPLL